MKIDGILMNNLKFELEGYIFRLDLDHNTITFGTGYTPQIENSEFIIQETNEMIQDHKFEILNAIYEKYRDDFSEIKMITTSIDEGQGVIHIYWKLKAH